jgi:WD40 repeat protein
MKPDRARRAYEIFKQALDVPAEERSAWVKKQCDGATDVHDEVMSLINSHASSSEFLETPAVEEQHATPIGDPTVLVGKTLGRYRVLSVLGAGGMGAVYLAEQLHPSRTVALKVLRPEVWSPSVRRRFIHEAQILARLKHPNIAQVFEVDTHAEGAVQLPFFAMEYVEGALPIDEYARRHNLEQRQRIELFCKVCKAVHHGHQKSVIHRDLKPANILVDQNGEPKIIDFGVARLTADDNAARTLRTEAGQLLGTLQYMSPEQCAADPSAIDVRTDVYALGVVLYELLCESAPYELKDSSIAAAVRIIQDRAPRRPASINVSLRGDLETIVLTALQKDQSRRYESATAFSDDLERFLRHEPITAHPPSLFYQARLFARRNRVLVGAAFAVALALTAGIIGSLTFAFSAERARAEAVWQSYVGNIAAAESAHQANEFARMRTKLADAAEDHRGWEWRYLTRLAEPSLAVLTRLEDRIDFVQYSGDGRRLYTASRDGIVRALDPSDGAELDRFAGHTGICSAALSNDDSLLVTCGYDGRVLLWDVELKKMIHAFAFGTPHEQLESDQERERFMRAAIGPDNRHIAIAAVSGSIHVWNVTSGSLLTDAFRHVGTVRRVVFHPTEPLLFSCGDDGCIRFWDLEAMREAAPPLQVSEQPVLDIAFNAAFTQVCAATYDGMIALIDLESGSTLQTFEGHPGTVRGIDFSPDYTRLYSAGAHHAIGVWDVESGALLAMRGGHSTTISMLDRSPDGSRLATVAWDGTLRLWETAVDDTFDVLRVHDDLVQSIAFSPDNRTIVTGGRDNSIVFTDADTMRTVRTLDDHDDWVRSVVFNRSGNKLATCSTDRTVRIRNAASGETTCMIRVASTALSAAFSPDGTRMVVGEDSGQVTVYDVATGQFIKSLHRHDDRTFVVAWSNDGSRIASASWDGTSKLWEGDTYAPVATITEHDEELYAMTFSPDSSILATGGRGMDIGIWDARTGTNIRMLRGHGQFVTGLAFSPEGSRLASASWFQTIKLWDTSRWEEVLTLHGGPDSSIRCLAFSSDGSRLATGSEDSTVRFWDTLSPQSRRARASTPPSPRGRGPG